MWKLTGPIFFSFLPTILGLFACVSDETTDKNLLLGKSEGTEISVMVEETGEPVPCETITIDNFDLESNQIYTPFGRENTLSLSGFGIYYLDANIRVSKTVLNGASNAVEFEYSLPSHEYLENWLSIRKEFDTVLDLRDCDGIEAIIQLKEIPKSTFRLTIADVTDSRNIALHGEDELWWFDIPNNQLNTVDKILTIKAPFASFEMGHGVGIRTNNYKLDLSRIIAYELNFITEAGQSDEGGFFLTSIKGYKN